ncbi:hypothetical protein LWI28_003370 [Acer negundo]|uniref:RNase H type-1 domain-containing protein n=1 Tax=Acer negundo TaxID=4023 RepID=A0AAD5JCA6_ACENE|nr:hypothetical protein LWI28_003370 [Acer negundo]
MHVSYGRNGRNVRGMSVGGKNSGNVGFIGKPSGVAKLIIASKSPDWLPPTQGSLNKLNTNVSVRASTCFISMGAMVRDSNGMIVVAVSKRIAGHCSTEIGEFLALQESIIMAKQYNVPISMVEVDASTDLL